MIKYKEHVFLNGKYREISRKSTNTQMSKDELKSSDNKTKGTLPQ